MTGTRTAAGERAAPGSCGGQAIPTTIAARNGHILIGGTGRAGTTLLVQLLTRLGFDTGYSIETAASAIDPVSRGGLERRLSDPNLPEVVKSPYLCDDILPALAAGFPVKVVIVPIRDLFEAAESRRSISKVAVAMGRDAHSAWGGLWATEKPEGQEAALAVKFYRLIQPLVAYDVPIIWLDFPRFVNDPAYFHRQMQALFDGRGITIEQTTLAFDAFVRPEIVGNSVELARTLPDILLSEPVLPAGLALEPATTAAPRSEPEAPTAPLPLPLRRPKRRKVVRLLLKLVPMGLGGSRLSQGSDPFARI